jgi:tetratricopeptide (TPR) repeat protein
VEAYFHDGILWAGLGPQPDVFSLLSRWGMLLGIASAEIAKLTSIQAWITAIHAAIGVRKLLLVIDDVWKLEDGLAFKVGGPHCAYIVTTRFPQLALQFAAEGATLVEELNEDDSMALLAQLAPAFVANEPGEAQTTLRSLAVFPAKPNSFSEEAALAVSNVPVEMLDVLTDVGLLEVRGQEQYSLHQTIADMDVRGLYKQAELYLRRAKDAAAVCHDKAGMAVTLLHLGDVMIRHGDSTQAEAYLQEGLALAHHIGYRERIGLLLTNLGWIATEQGKYAQAEGYFQEGLVVANQIGNQWLICGTLKFLYQIWLYNDVMGWGARSIGPYSHPIRSYLDTNGGLKHGCSYFRTQALGLLQYFRLYYSVLRFLAARCMPV